MWLTRGSPLFKDHVSIILNMIQIILKRYYLRKIKESNSTLIPEADVYMEIAALKTIVPKVVNDCGLSIISLILSPRWSWWE